MDDVPRPHLDANSHSVLLQAVRTLAVLRGCATPTSNLEIDPGHVLHLLATLVRQAHQHLPAAIEQAHDHGYSWTHIRMLLDS
jgi:hypothetical protein